MNTTDTERHHVVVVGGGFGGLYTVQALRDAPLRVTLIDKRNFHLFQPLLYQVATGGLSPGDIGSPLRAVLKNQANARVVLGEVVDIDPNNRQVILSDGAIGYDSLVLATGMENHYFGHRGWESQAPGLKTVEDAIEIRRRILLAFETAERQTDSQRRQAWMTFVVIGGGPTGVELAGAIAELAHNTLRGEFKTINPADAQIILLEGKDAILPEYPEQASSNARRSLEKLGVTVLTGALVEEIRADGLRYRQTDGSLTHLDSHTILWAAGMRAASLSRILHERTGAELDRAGRVVVTPELALPGHAEIYVIGDMAHFLGPDGEPLPGVAPVAMQQGRYVARLIQKRQAGEQAESFAYKDKGSLAVIGRNAAVAVFGRLRIAGFPAWVAWIFIHLWFLIEYDKKLLVLIQWAWNYFTRKRGARLITGEESIPRLEHETFRSASQGKDASPSRTSPAITQSKVENQLSR